MQTIQDAPETVGDGFWEELEPLLDSGIRVIPVVAGAKTPAWKHWAFGRNGRPYTASSATTDRGRLKGATERGLRPNIGVPTGQPWGGGYLNAIDLDPRNGGDVAFTELCDELGPPPETAMVQTLNGGTHIYLWTRSCWTDTPKELAPGVEFKRAGQFVMAPPSNGYAWVHAPWEEGSGGGVSSWDAWDSLLGLEGAAQASGLLAEISVDAPAPKLETWGSVDEYQLAIAGAAPGKRTETLLRFGGKIAWATAVGVGLGSPAAVASALWRACETNGLVADYPEEVLRKIEVFEQWSDPARNPLLLRRENDGERISVIGSPQLGEVERAVLLDLGSMARAEGHAYTKRYGAIRTGYGDRTVYRALKSLERRGLIERGANLWNPGGKASHSYKLTKLGNLVRRQLEADA